MVQVGSEQDGDWQPEVEAKLDNDSKVQLLIPPRSPSVPTSCASNSSSDNKAHSRDDKAEVPPLIPKESLPCYDSDDEEEDPDDVSEDLPPPFTDQDGNNGQYNVEEAFQSQDYTALHGIEKDNDKYKKKFDS